VGVIYVLAVRLSLIVYNEVEIIIIVYVIIIIISLVNNYNL